jgi:hypothetical protein
MVASTTRHLAAKDYVSTKAATPLTTVPVLFRERECWLNNETPGVDQGLILVSSIIAQRTLWISEAAWSFR